MLSLSIFFPSSQEASAGFNDGDYYSSISDMLMMQYRGHFEVEISVHQIWSCDFPCPTHATTTIINMQRPGGVGLLTDNQVGTETFVLLFGEGSQDTVRR